MDEAAVTKIDPRSRLRRGAEATWKETKWQTYLLYCRFIYRHHMRFIHRRGRHRWTHYNLIDGPKFDKCNWCGAILKEKRKGA